MIAHWLASTVLTQKREEIEFVQVKKNRCVYKQRCNLSNEKLSVLERLCYFRWAPFSSAINLQHLVSVCGACFGKFKLQRIDIGNIRYSHSMCDLKRYKVENNNVRLQDFLVGAEFWVSPNRHWEAYVDMLFC